MKAQGATEYLVLVGVVLMIALVCITILVWPTSSTKDVKQSQTDIGIGIGKIACAELAQGLILHWKFNEGVGDRAYNSAGPNINDATLYNGTSWVSGIRGKAVDFGGGDDYFMLNGTSNMPSTGITNSFWIKTSDSADGIFSYATDSQNNEWLLYNSANINIYRAAQAVASGVSVNNNAWHHVAVTWSNSSGSVQLYKDGALAYSGTLVGVPITNGGCVTLGQEQDSRCNNFAAIDTFTGQLDDVRMYNRVLPAQEIELLYKNPECP